MLKEATPEALAIVTVNFNSYKVTREFIDSLAKQTDRDFYVFIIDLSTVKEEYEWPTWVTIFDGPNGGYSFGVNSGVREAVEMGYEHFVVINNDTVVAEDFVKQVKTALAVHPHGLVGGKIYYYPGFEFHPVSKEDRGKVLWYAGGSVDWDHIAAHHRGVNEVDTGQYDKEEMTGFITGCFVAFALTTYRRIGQWDESYFLYWEDVDWSERAIRQGLTLWYVPSIVLWHKNAQSTGGSGSSIHQTYQERNRLRFGLQYGPFRTKVHLIKNIIFRWLRRIT
jgi:GT2 family glycosyltransferase